MESGEWHGEESTSADQRISRLHEVARELQSASTKSEVYDAVIDAAVETLGFDSCSVSVPADGVFDERAVSESAPFDEGVRSFRVDEGAIGRAFQNGETIITENAIEDGVSKPSDESIVSGISVPLGEKGVFQGYSAEVGVFDEGDAEVADLLCAHATAALERIERDRKLQEKNEQLEQFASFVSHDLRNPLSVAQLRLDLARSECDSEHLDDVTQAHDRMETLIDELLMLAKAGQGVNDMETVDLSTFAKTCWQTVETGEATLEIATDRTLHADENRFRQLFENLIRNAVEHGSTGSRTQSDDAVEHGSKTREQSGQDGVTIRIGNIEDGFYVADDGPGIPEDERDEIFGSGYSTSEDGTGYGLTIVEEIVEAHDWTVTVEESVDGGARFEIEL